MPAGESATAISLSDSSPSAVHKRPIRSKFHPSVPVLIRRTRMNAKLNGALIVAMSLNAIGQVPFRLTSPHDGDKLYRSDSIRVSWVGGAVGLPIRLLMSRNGRSSVMLTDSAHGASFVMPANGFASGQYTFRLTSYNTDTSSVPFGNMFDTPFSDVAINPNGTRLSVANADGIVRLRDMYTGAIVREYSPSITRDLHNGSWGNGRTSYSADGQRLLVTFKSPLPRGLILDVDNGSILWSDTTTDEIDMSSDAALVSVRNVVIRIATGDTLAKMRDSTTTPTGLFFSNDGKHLISYDLAAVTLWSLGSGKKVHRWTTPSPTAHARFDPLGGTVMAVGTSWIIGWDVLTGARTTAAPLEEPVANSISFSPDGSRVAVGYWYAGRIRLYNSRSGKELFEFRTGREAIKTVAFSSDDERVVWIDMLGRGRIMHIENQVETHQSETLSLTVLPPRIDVRFDGDFGNTIAPSNNSTYHGCDLFNSETVPVRISSSTIQGPDSNAFRAKYDRYDPDSTIPGGMSRRVHVYFSPNRLGRYAATLVVAMGPDTIRHAITGVGVVQPIQAVVGGVHFGIVPLLASRDTVIAIVRNVDSVPHTVNIAMDGYTNDSTAFELADGGGTFELQAGTERVVHIKFTARGVAGTTSETNLGVSFDGIGSPFSVIVLGINEFFADIRDVDDPRMNGMRILSISPTSISLRIPMDTYELLLVDLLGRVRRIDTREQEMQVTIDISSLVAGYHVIAARTPRGIKSLPLVLMR